MSRLPGLGRRPLGALWLLFGAAAAGCLSEPAAGPEPEPGLGEAAEFGRTRVVGRPPYPWFIEGAAILGDRVFAGSAEGLVGSAVPANTFGEPSRLFVFALDDARLADTRLVEGEDTTRPHGLTGLKTDAAGRIYAASTQLGILRFTQGADGWSQETYARIPDLPACLPGIVPLLPVPPATGPCSPTADDQPGLPNDMTWDDAGNLYVTDSFQATVWRVPPTGQTAGTESASSPVSACASASPSVCASASAAASERVPEPWYQHAALDRAFGANGLRIGPAGDRMYIAVCCPDSAAAGPVDRASRIAWVPFPEPGDEAPLDFARLPTGEGADGIAFNEAGDLYVVSNGGDKILVYGPDGGLLRTIANAQLSGEGRFTFPASLVFRPETRSLVVVNYAIFDASPMGTGRSVVEVFVDDLPWAAATPRPP